MTMSEPIRLILPASPGAPGHLEWRDRVAVPPAVAAWIAEALTRADEADSLAEQRNAADKRAGDLSIALTRAMEAAVAHADERKAWQEATDRQTPEAAKEWLDRAEHCAGTIARRRDEYLSRAEQAEQDRNVAVVARGLAETAAKEATARAEQAEAEVARLTMLIADAPPPDAADHEIARSLVNARAASWTALQTWDESSEHARRSWITAIATVIRPRLDALRAEVTRLTAALATAEQARDVVTGERDRLRAQVEARTDIVSIDEVVDADLPRVEAFELPVVEWKKDTEGNLIAPFVGSPIEGWTDSDGKWNLSIDGTAPDEPTARARVEEAVALLAGRAEVRR